MITKSNNYRVIFINSWKIHLLCNKQNACIWCNDVILLFSFSVPPGRPLIHNERGILVESTLGPYNEGSKLRLTCSVSGGKKLFSIHSYCFEMCPVLQLLQQNSIWMKMHLNYPIYYSGIGFVRLSVKLMFLTKQIKSSTFAWPKNYAVHKFRVL